MNTCLDMANVDSGWHLAPRKVMPSVMLPIVVFKLLEIFVVICLAIELWFLVVRRDCVFAFGFLWALSGLMGSAG